MAFSAVAMGAISQHKVLIWLWSCLFCFLRGVLREGDQLLLGPSVDGHFQPVTVTSVKRNRAACRVVRAGQAASVAISGIDRSLLRRVRWN